MHDWEERIVKKDELAENLIIEKQKMLDGNNVAFNTAHKKYMSEKLDVSIKGNAQRNRYDWIELNKKFAIDLFERSGISKKHTTVNWIAHLNAVEAGVWFGGNYIDALVSFYDLEFDSNWKKNFF